MKFTKDFANMSQGPPKPGFRSMKVRDWDFLKKDSQDFENSFQFGFLWILSKPGKQNQKIPFFDIHNCKKNSARIKYVILYSHLSNNRWGWNKRGGEAKLPNH